MIDFTNVELDGIIIHQIGNKLREEGLKISKSVISLEDEETNEFLLKYFLTPFSSDEFYNFTHPSDLKLNEIYSFTEKLFTMEETLYLASVDIAKHLYEQSTHPKIIAGELCVCYFKNCIVDGESIDAIGLFKSEGKDVFLKFDSENDHFTIRHESGVNINKLDKGCLIFNIDKQDGYRVCTVDSNKSHDAQYWKNDFLNVKPAADNYHFTKDFLSITKNFVTKQLSEEFEVTKADQIDLLNRSVEYFKNNERFNKNSFEDEVFQEDGIINSFRSFDKNYREENEVRIEDNFDISTQALKKQARIFKSVLKLDKNFHIYIHGDRDLIEQGVDSDGRKFYKIYYKEEQ